MLAVGWLDQTVPPLHDVRLFHGERKLVPASSWKTRCKPSFRLRQPKPHFGAHGPGVIFTTGFGVIFTAGLGVISAAGRGVIFTAGLGVFLLLTLVLTEKNDTRKI